MNKEQLNTNSTDIIVSGISAAVGLVPLAGGFLSELVQGVIPHQREDRIVEFIVDLNSRLEKMEISIDDLKNIYSNYKYGAFTYKCLNNVVNEVYEEKIAYYKELCIKGITSEEKELCRIERILRILAEMDYYELIYLKYYYYVKRANYVELKKITDELEIVSVIPNYVVNMSTESRNSETYKQITLNNLEKNGLLDIEIGSIRSGGKLQKKHKITLLGELILDKIGVLNNEKTGYEIKRYCRRED